MGELAAGDHVVDVALGQIGRGRAHVPVVLEGDRAHAALRRLDRDLDHVLRAVDEIGIGVDVAVDRALEQLVFDPRIDFQHLRVVFEHLIEIILGVELACTRSTLSVRPTIKLSAAAASAAKSHMLSPSVDQFKVKSKVDVLVDLILGLCFSIDV